MNTDPSSAAGAQSPDLSRLSSPAQTGTQPDIEQTGEVLSAEEIADYAQLRNLVSPEKSLALLDDFAKWLFATAAVVGTLGASFGVSSANTLTGEGKRMFAYAVACIGVSLGLAALARLPLRIRVNRYSDVSLAARVATLTKRRGRLLFLAALLFAAALILAGLSPLFS
jgi:hypothetical protein